MKKDKIICELCKNEITSTIICIDAIKYRVKKKQGNKFINFIKMPFICEACFNKIKK